MRCHYWGISLLLCSTIFAQPVTRPASTAELAEISLLRRTSEKQRQEIDLLKSQVTILSDQIRSLGLVPSTQSAATQPVVGPVRRVIFLRVSTSGSETDQITRAVSELDSSQYFNVLTPTHLETYRFQPQLVQATDAQKKKAKEYLLPNVTILAPDWLNGIDAAAKWRPDVIWLVGYIIPNAPEEEAINEMKKRLAGTGTRVNTSLVFQQHGVAGDHLLWRIAHETGGLCLDKSGNLADEPALPVKPLPLVPPPPPKSVLPIR